MTVTFKINVYWWVVHIAKISINLHPYTYTLQVKERPDIGVYVKNLTGVVVKNADDLDRIMTLGSKNSKLHFHSVINLVGGNIFYYYNMLYLLIVKMLVKD